MCASVYEWQEDRGEWDPCYCFVLKNVNRSLALVALPADTTILSHFPTLVSVTMHSHPWFYVLITTSFNTSRGCPLKHIMSSGHLLCEPFKEQYLEHVFILTWTLRTYRLNGCIWLFDALRFEGGTNKLTTLFLKQMENLWKKTIYDGK